MAEKSTSNYGFTQEFQEDAHQSRQRIKESNRNWTEVLYDWTSGLLRFVRFFLATAIVLLPSSRMRVSPWLLFFYFLLTSTSLYMLWKIIRRSHKSYLLTNTDLSNSEINKRLTPTNIFIKISGNKRDFRQTLVYYWYASSELILNIFVVFFSLS